MRPHVILSCAMSLDGYIDDDTVDSIERDNRAVRWCVESHRDGDDPEQNQHILRIALDGLRYRADG